MKLKEINLNMHINKCLNFTSIIIHPSILSIYGHNGHFLVFLDPKIFFKKFSLQFVVKCTEM